LAIPFTPAAPIPGVRYSLLRSDANPLDLGDEIRGEIPHIIDAVAVFLPWERISGQTLRRWWRQGIRRCWFLRERDVVGIRPFWAMAFRGYSNNMGGQAPAPGLAVDSCRAFLARVGAERLLQPPDVLHCWLDHANVVGLVGAKLAGTPAALLSLRGLSPRAAPRLATPWLEPWYRLAFELPGVCVVANSDAGARDYEAWLGLKRGTIGVLRNAFVPPPAPDAKAVADFRK